jgi:hypothetical protein
MSWTKEIWYYDYRTNVHHTLKKKTMRFDDLADFIKCYNPADRHKRKETWNANAAAIFALLAYAPRPLMLRPPSAQTDGRATAPTFKVHVAITGALLSGMTKG